MIVVLWTIVGLIVGFCAGIYAVILYGDGEINDKIAEIRQDRLKLHKMKYEIRAKKLLLYVNLSIKDVKDFLAKREKRKGCNHG